MRRFLVRLLILLLSSICTVAACKENAESRRNPSADMADPPYEVPAVFLPADAGIVDVTKAPYFARGDGVTDDTNAINRALRDHNNTNSPSVFMSWTVYLPPGTYLVSDTLTPKDPTDSTKSRSTVRLIGAGMNRTTIRLADNASGFDDPRTPRHVLRTGNAGNQPNSGFGNYVEHLTVNSGSGNRGAIGIRYDVANNGAMRHVRVISGDSSSAGLAGIAFYGTSGLGYVRDVVVDGFDVGIHVMDGSTNNLVFENIFLSSQRRAGIINASKVISVLGLTSVNSVPALVARRPEAVSLLFNSDLKGVETLENAIEVPNASYVFLRDVRISGYARAMRGHKIATSAVTVEPTGTTVVAEWQSHDLEYETTDSSLDLPVEPSAEFIPDETANWLNVESFGARPDDGVGDAKAVNDAIAAGADVLYFPRGTYHLEEDVVIEDSVRKIDFFHSQLVPLEDHQPTLVSRASSTHTVNLENFVGKVNVVHAGSGTTVVKNATSLRFRNAPGSSGKVFLENVGPHPQISIGPNMKAWLRSINREGQGMQIDGATVWLLGDNIERMGHSGSNQSWVRPISVSNSQFEMLGGALDALTIVHRNDQGPLISALNSQISLIYAGELRFARQWGSWPEHVHCNGRFVDRKISDAATYQPLSKTNRKSIRFVMPLFSAQCGEYSNAAQ